jgi:hypothetical protein
VLRQPIIRAELQSIFDDFYPLINDLSTASSAHKVLKEILGIQCMLSTTTEYGLPMIDESLLRIADSSRTYFLV